MIYASEAIGFRPLSKDEYAILCISNTDKDKVIFLTLCPGEQPPFPEKAGHAIRISFKQRDIPEQLTPDVLSLFTVPVRRIELTDNSGIFCLSLCRKAAADPPDALYHNQMLHSVLSALLSELLQIQSALSHVRDYGEKSIVNVISYIETHYAEKLSIDKLAKIAYMSKSYFSHSFKEIIGETPVEYINRLRISAAVKLVSMDNFSTHELAERLGFSSNSYFCYTFKKITGMSPRQFGKFSDSTLSLSPEQKNFEIII